METTKRGLIAELREMAARHPEGEAAICDRAADALEEKDEALRALLDQVLVELRRLIGRKAEDDESACATNDRAQLYHAMEQARAALRAGKAP